MHDEDARPVPRERIPSWLRKRIDLLDQHASSAMYPRCEGIGIAGMDDWVGAGDPSFDKMAPVAPCFRFAQGDLTAYVWNLRDDWHLSPWHPWDIASGRTSEPVDSFGQALERLERLLPLAEFRLAFGWGRVT